MAGSIDEIVSMAVANRKPTKIVLEVTLRGDQRHAALRVFGEGFAPQGTAIESAVLKTGKSLPGLRKYGEKYAKRFSIHFIDNSEQ